MARSGFWGSFFGTAMVLVAIALAASALLNVTLYRDWAEVQGADAYDPATKQWSVQSGIVLDPRGLPRSGPPHPGDRWTMVALHDGTAVAVTHAGRGGSSAVRTPSPSSLQWYDGQQWISLGELERSWTTLWATRLDDGRIVMADPGATVVLDPVLRSMRSLAAPPLGAGSTATLVASGDRVYATTTNTEEGVAVLDLDEDTWTPLPPCPTVRRGATPRALPGGGLLLADGFGPAHDLREDVVPTLVAILVVAALLLLGGIWWVRRGLHGGGLAAGLLVGGVLGLFVAVFFAALASVEGRPLRVGRRVWRGRVRGGRARRKGSELAWPTRWLLTRAWASDAALEHASIAAFEQLAQQLEAAGAPSELVASARTAAVEEAEHTRRCLALAERHAERELVLAPLPALPVPSACEGREREALLVRLAIESFVDGTLGEGFAAASAAAALAEATDPEVRRTLEIIARDEASHAAHARDVVAWCEAEGGEPVREAVRRVAERERGRVRHRGLPLGRWTDALARHGRFREARPGALDAALRARL